MANDPVRPRRAGTDPAPASVTRATPRRTPVTVYTVGHSTRSVDELVEILRAAGVRLLVDIRTVPRSRHNPQFDRDSIALPLASAGIGYLHLAALGGLRRPRPGSPNVGWRNDSFRGFADYMAEPEFRAGLEELLARAEVTPLAVMCAEAVPWRCHRSLVADALAVRGLRVVHLLAPGRAQEHRITPWATLRGVTLVYGAPSASGQRRLGEDAPTGRRGDP